MSRDDVQKLLGGYATGTLTEDEQQALFAAALEDQEIFDALAKEQSLRDLLRDPAAKGAVLAALDSRGRGMWAWARRPWVAGLAMAGLAAVGVGLWWELRKPAESPVIVALNQPPVAAPAPGPAAAPPAVDKVEATAPSRSRLASELRADQGRAGQAREGQAAAGQLQRQEQTADQAERRDLKAPPAAPVGEEKKDIAAVAQAKPAENLQLQQAQNAAAPPPAPFNSSQNSNSQVSNTQTVQVQGFAVPAQDARALFYDTQLPIQGQAFAAGTGGARAAAAERTASPAKQKVAAPKVEQAAVLSAAHLGIKCSILRGDAEVDLATPLSVGESVKLRITPNADGFLYVMEGGAIAASGPARRMQPFETPVLKSDAAGARQFRVVLSQAAISTGVAGVAGGFAKQNLVETAAEREQATYMVLDGRAPAQPFVATITLTWK